MNRKQRRAAAARAGAGPGAGGPDGTAGRVRIVAVSAFWRNDKPGGLGLTKEFDGENDGAEFAQVLLDSLPQWDAHATALDNLEQLVEITRAGERDQRAAITALLNINWLVERGHLMADEYNGLQWALAQEDRGVVAITEKNPLTITHVEGTFDEAVDVSVEVRAQSTAALRVINDWIRQQGRKPLR